MINLVGFIKPYKIRFFSGIFIKFIASIMDLFLPWILAYIIDHIIPKGNITLVWKAGVIMFFSSILSVVFNIIANRYAASVARDATKDIRLSLFEKIMYLNNKDIDYYSTPSLISRMTTDTYHVHHMIGMFQRMGIRAPILLLGGLLVTFTLDPILTLTLLTVIPFVVLATVLLTKKGIISFKNAQTSLDKMIRSIRESIVGIRYIKGLSKVESANKKFNLTNEEVLENEKKANETMAILSPIVNFLINGGSVLVILVGAHRVYNGQGKVGSIIAFMSYFHIILHSVMAITRIVTNYSRGSASMDRISEILNLKEERKKGESKLDFSKKPLIEFQKVYFKYNINSEYALSNISFKLHKGESLGIIGPTGSGKSTLGQLMMNFYEASSGEIYILGQEISTIDKKILRNLFGVVFQHDMLFQGDLEYNIKLDRDITIDNLNLAIQTAQAQNIIKEKHGLKGSVAIKGANFSGGQKQRILIARALAAYPTIIILDDASSALDYKTDSLLRESMSKKYNSTLILMAQRISSVMNCDNILVLDEGNLVGFGQHDKLLKDCDIYRQMFEIQLGEVSKVEN